MSHQCLGTLRHKKQHLLSAAPLSVVMTLVYESEYEGMGRCMFKQGYNQGYVLWVEKLVLLLELAGCVSWLRLPTESIWRG